MGLIVDSVITYTRGVGAVRNARRNPPLDPPLSGGQASTPQNRTISVNLGIFQAR